MALLPMAGGVRSAQGLRLHVGINVNIIAPTREPVGCLRRRAGGRSRLHIDVIVLFFLAAPGSEFR